jgi:hypothetical protein
VKMSLVRSMVIVRGDYVLQGAGCHSRLLFLL